MLNADVLTFREFVMHDPLPLSKIQEAILEFLQGREDTVLFGAQAVNAYVDEPRMTQDVDILSTRAKAFADELREYLSEKFHIAIRIREVGEKGLRIYQVRKDGNRHLADIRAVTERPETEVFENILVLSPPELIASKAISYQSRRGKPKSGTDWRDIAALLIQFPDLKEKDGRVLQILKGLNAAAPTLAFWEDLVDQNLELEGEDDDLDF
jgi:hypothetical protein